MADEVAERVSRAAVARGVALEELAGEVLAEQFPPRRKLGFHRDRLVRADRRIDRRGAQAVRLDHFADKAASDV